MRYVILWKTLCCFEKLTTATIAAGAVTISAIWLLSETHLRSFAYSNTSTDQSPSRSDNRFDICTDIFLPWNWVLHQLLQAQRPHPNNGICAVVEDAFSASRQTNKRLAYPGLATRARTFDVYPGQTYPRAKYRMLWRWVWVMDIWWQIWELPKFITLV